MGFLVLSAGATFLAHRITLQSVLKRGREMILRDEDVTSLAPARVLLAVNDLDLLRVWAFALQRRGYQVIPTDNGFSALIHWQTVQPDVAVLDVEYPDLTGLEVAQRIRRHGATPMILLTDTDDEEHVLECYRQGADCVLVKPFLVQDLARQIEALSVKKQAGAS